MKVPSGEEISYKEEGLFMGEHSVAQIAQAVGTPLYLYSAAQIRKNIAALRNQLRRINKGHEEKTCIYYAMKSNRFRDVMDLMRNEKDIGIDACSPAEIEYSKECGFQKSEISYTGCFLSTSDLDYLAKEGVHINFDTLTGIRKYAALKPKNTTIGLRVNPGIDLGFSPLLKYNQKFGFPMDEFDQALKEARSRGLTVNTLLYHNGWNIPARVKQGLEETLKMVLECAQKIGPDLEVVDVGGGLGVLHHYSQGASMDIDTWANSIETFLMAPLREINKNVRIVCEPGTRIMADTGILVAEVNTVETRGGTNWLGINAGKNLNCYTSYELPLTILPLKTNFNDGASDVTHQNGTIPEANAKSEVGREEEELVSYCIAGNINEGCDLFGTDVKLPPVSDGDYLALFPCGAYGTSMASNHCMRGEYKEMLLFDKFDLKQKRDIKLL